MRYSDTTARAPSCGLRSSSERAFLDHLAAVVDFLVVGKRRVAEYVEDAVAAKYSVRADAFGYLSKVGHVDYGDSGALYFFGHHCTAA